MPRLSKAWAATTEWADAPAIIHAETAGKARYRLWLDMADYSPETKLTEITVRRAKHRDITLPDEHRLVAALTPRQRQMIAHAYGSDGRNPGYRDHYCTHPGNLDALRLAWEFGLMEGPFGEAAHGETPGWSGAFFYLTALGRDVAKSMLPTYR